MIIWDNDNEINPLYLENPLNITWLKAIFILLLKFIASNNSLFTFSHYIFIAANSHFSTE